MKHRIFIYLFIFACIICIFQFVIGRNAFSILSKDNYVYKIENQNLKDSISLLNFQLNENRKIRKKLQNPYLDSITKNYNIKNPENWFRENIQLKENIDSLKIINQHWIWIHSSNHSNEKILLLKYNIVNHNTINFKVIDSIYTQKL